MMGNFISTAATLMLVYTSSFGVELLLDRYATPKARAQLVSTPAVSSGEQEEPGKRSVVTDRSPPASSRAPGPAHRPRASGKGPQAKDLQ